MTKRTTTTVIALTGAVALASGAYAIGSQSDGGSALASGTGTTTTSKDPGRPGDRGFGPAGRRDGRGLDALAKKLGVDSAKLQTALRELRDENKPGDRRADLAAALASALGIPTAKVTAAFDQVETARRTAFAAAPAKELGLSTDKVEAALAKVKPDGKPGERPRRDGDHGAKLKSLASELGVSEAKLLAALRKVRPGGPGHFGPGGPRRIGPGGPGSPGGPGGPGGPGHRGPRGFGGPAGGAAPAELAKALGITQAELKAALKKVWTAEQAKEKERRDAMAAALAKKLGIPEAKVKAALDSLPRGGRGRHP